MADASFQQNSPAGEDSFEVVNALLGAAGFSGAEFTSSCREIFLLTIPVMKWKKADGNTLSSSSYVLTALLLARNIARNGPSILTSALTEELELLRRWGTLVNKEYREQFHELLISYFTEEPSLEILTSPHSSFTDEIRFGPGLLRAIERLRGAIPIDFVRLISSLLEDRKTGIAINFSSFKLDNLATLLIDRSQIAQPPVDGDTKGSSTEERGNENYPSSEERRDTSYRSRPGRLSAMSREARPEELALRISDFALALSTILRSAEGEFTFALFGRWGSGKTTLVSVLAPLMRDVGEYKRAIYATTNTPYTQITYEVVFHNAWKYKSPPEAWVFLYKSLADRASRSTGFFGRLFTAIRTSIEKNGPWPLTAAMLVLVLAVIPATATLQILAVAGSAIGFAILMHLASVTVGVSSKVRELFAKHMRLAGAEEKLGMLALIGDDVKALVKGWVAVPDKALRDKIGEDSPVKRILPATILVAIVSALWGYGLFRADQMLGVNTWQLLPPWLEPLMKWINSLIKNRWNEVPNVGDWIVWAVWSIGALLALILPNLPLSKRPDRLLLVVDDLDRCAPAEMLKVIEGIKLLLDDRQVNSRLQVLMLVDENVLDHAIASKYASMIADRSAESDDKEAARAEVIAEQKEKLFACHLRLPYLSVADMATLVDSLANYEIVRERNEQQGQEEQRLKRERDTALAAQRDAYEQLQRAESSYRDVEQGHSRPLVDVDAPGPVQPPVQERIKTGIDFVPPSSEERERREMSNRNIERYDEQVSKLSPAERLARNPGVKQELGRARERIESADKHVSELTSVEGPTAVRDAPFDQTDVRFTEEEVRQLRVFVPQFFQSTKRVGSPRAIRALLFKVQLCRLLLQLRFPGKPEESLSIPVILEAFAAAANSPRPEGGEPDSYGIARQVV